MVAELPNMSEQEKRVLSLLNPDIPSARVDSDRLFFRFGSCITCDDSLYSSGVDSSAYSTYVTDRNRQRRENDFSSRFGFKNEEFLRQVLVECAAIADFGTGPGILPLWLSELAPHATVFAFDSSDMLNRFDKHFGPVDNLVLGFSNLNEKLPLGDNSLDFAVIDYVLDRLDNPQNILLELERIVKPGGLLACSFSIEAPLVRRLTDDHFMNLYSELRDEKIDTIAQELTNLASELERNNGNISIENEYPEIGIHAGQYTFQRFIYYFFLKCFWNNDEKYSFNRNRTNFKIIRQARRIPRDFAFSLLPPGFVIENTDSNPSTLSLLCRRISIPPS